MYASVCEALMGPKPGKPGLVVKAPLIWLPFSSTRFPAALVTWKPWWLTSGVPAPSCGATYRCPNRAWNPLYPPGSSGRTSDAAVGEASVCPNLTPLASAQNALPWRAVHGHADVIGGLGVLEGVLVRG